NILGDRDLHMVNIAPVPDWLENAVPEPEHENVLHRFFSKVVINRIDLRFTENFGDVCAKCAGRIEIAAEWLLNDDAPPMAIFLTNKSRIAELINDRDKMFRRGCEIEQAVGVFKSRLKLRINIRLIKIAFDIIELCDEFSGLRLFDF